MKAALSAFPTPSTYSDILTYINVTWENQTSYLEVLKKDQRDNFAKESLIYLRKRCEYATPDNISSLIVGCGIIFRSYLRDLSPLFPLFDKLFIANRECDMLASVKLISHISALTDEVNPVFSKRYLKLSCDLIDTGKEEYMKYGLLVIQEFLMKLPSIILLYFPNISTFLWKAMLSPFDANRRMAITNLSTYISEQAHSPSSLRHNIFQNLFSNSLELLKEENHKNQHSGILVIAALITYKGSFFEDSAKLIFDELKPFIYSTSFTIKLAALSTMTHLAQVNLKFFENNVYDFLFSKLMELTKDKDEIVFILDIFCALIDLVPNLIYKNIQLIIGLLLKTSPEMKRKEHERIISFLSRVLELDYKLLEMPNDELWALVSNETLSHEFVQFFKKMKEFYPEFETNNQSNLYKLAIKVLGSLDNKCHEALELIATLNITTSFAKQVLPMIKSVFFSKVEEHRVAAPKALIHIIAADPNKFLEESADILQLGICDFSSAVRSAVIRSFDDDKTLFFLSKSNIANNITVFAKDKNFEVRILYFKLLKRLARLCPIIVQTTIRNELASTDITLRTSSTLYEKVVITKPLPALISASGNIRTYDSTLILTIVDMLIFSGNDDILFLELELKLKVSLLQSLQSFAMISFDIIKPYFDKISVAITKILAGNNKDMKEAVIDFLTTILRSNTELDVVYKYLSPIFPSVISSIGSSSMQSFIVKALKFVGEFGAISPRKIGATVVEENSDLNLYDPSKMKNMKHWSALFGEVIFNKLLSMMDDKTFNIQRQLIFQTAISVVGVLKTVPNSSFEILMNNLFALIEESSDNDKVNALMQLHNLILLTKQRVCPYVPKIMRIVNSFWKKEYLEATLTVVMTLIIEVHTDFSDFVGPLFSKILEALSASTVGHPEIAKICLPLLAFLGPSYSNSVSLIFPQICVVISLDTTPRDVLLIALTSLRYLVQIGDPSFHATAIFSSVIDFISPNTDNEVRSIAIDVIFSLMIRIGDSFVIYAHRIIDAIGNNALLQSEFQEIAEKLNNEPVIEVSDFPFISTDPPITLQPSVPKAKGLNLEEFESSLNVSFIELPKQWNTWLAKTVLLWVDESPSPVVSLLHDVVSGIPEFLDFVIFPAFFSCWYDIGQKDRQRISKMLLEVMNNKYIPGEILMKFLRLCEMMDRVNYPLAVNPLLINDLCLKTHYNSYAIHINQSEFFKTHDKDFAHSAATLLLESEKSFAGENIFKKFPIDNQKQLLFRLGRWQQAISLYEDCLQNEPLDADAFVEYVTCARNIPRFNLIYEKEHVLQQLPKAAIKQCATSFAMAFFMKGNYDKMYQYAKMADKERIESQIIISFASLLTDRFDEAEKWCETGFNTISQQKRTFFSIGYSAAYQITIYCQILWEFHEYIQTKGNINQELWKKRMSNLYQDIDSWSFFIMMRFSKCQRDLNQYYQFLNMALLEGKFDVFEAYYKLDDSNSPALNLMKLKFFWATGKRDDAIKGIKDLVNSQKSSKEAVVSYFDWIITMNHDPKTLRDIADKLKQFMGEYSYEIYLRWGYINYHLSKVYKDDYRYAVESIRGFVPAIRNSNSPQFSHMAQMLWLFFSTANNQDAYKETGRFIREIETEKFVDVIPQLIGQLGHDNADAAVLVQNIILQLASGVNREKVLFPLIVATFSLNAATRKRANETLQTISFTHNKEVIQCLKLSSLLILASQTLFELWANYSGDYYWQELIERTKKPQCPIDRLFAKIMGRQLKTIEYNTATGKDSSKEINEIIEISEQKVAETDRLRLFDVSDERNYDWSELDMPGTSSVKISSIEPNFDVLNSKQHPRKIVMVGTDGNRYKFLLKSNEDIGIDQRVMQYFKLVNLFLKGDYVLNSLNTTLRDYAIVPMNPQIGLIQWVEDSETISSMIEDYRRSQDVDPMLERKFMEESTIQKIDNLLPIQRHEMICFLSDGTPDDDLRRLMWLKAPTADHWIGRFLHLQRSAAINSITGYTLGLGDRHASNIMIDISSGDMIHIDFGDCFEVNLDRELFPEKIPFRLTRMLVAAFGIGGVETEFRNAAERVISVIRDNASSFASVLELFLLEGEQTSLGENMIKRTWDKMDGNDFEGKKGISPSEQVDLLIEAATDKYNLSCLYPGWSPLW